MRMMIEEKRSGIKYPYLNRDLQALATLEKVLVKQKTYEIYHDHEDPIKRRKMEKIERNIDKNFRSWSNRLVRKEG